MLPTITLRRLLVACALLIPAIASAAPLETDLGERLSTALSAITAPGGSMRLAYLLAFLGGLATSLTPCVYPLIPITISLFGAREAPRAQALGLAACYVGGIAATYTTLGLAVGLLGGQFGSFMTSPWVIVPVALFFLLMAASMFGAFELSLPNELQGRLSQVGGRGPIGAFLMGLVAGIVAASCTGPPLAALLDRLAGSPATRGGSWVVAAPGDPKSKGNSLALERAASTRDYLVGRGADPLRFSVSALGGAGEAAVIRIVVKAPPSSIR